jgi:hypothetical protein
MKQHSRFSAEIILVSAILAQGCSAVGFPIEFTLSQGQSTEIPGIDLKVEAIQVRDLTSQGCMGGPIGCPDSVELNVARATQSEQVALQVAHTEAQKAQRINQANAFGYRITLKDLQHGLAILLIDRP